jgi:hypothetical protein
MTDRSLVTALAVMVMLMVSPRPARAQVEGVTITVDGLTCNLCANYFAPDGFANTFGSTARFGLMLVSLIVICM